MSIRDDLIRIIAKNMYGDPVPDPDAPAEMWDPADTDEVLTTADAVLAWLGQLDRDADAELIALHLRDTRAELERLRERMMNLSNDRNRQVNDAAREAMRLRELVQVLSDALDHRTAWSGSCCMCTDEVCAVETADDALSALKKEEAGDA